MQFRRSLAVERQAGLCRLALLVRMGLPGALGVAHSSCPGAEPATCNPCVPSLVAERFALCSRLGACRESSGVALWPSPSVALVGPVVVFLVWPLVAASVGERGP